MLKKILDNIFHDHLTHEELLDYLKNKNSRNFSAKQRERNKNHLENCFDCWNKWNKIKWDIAKNSKGLQELREYLGQNYVEYFDSSWANAIEWEKRNPSTDEEISLFYKKNTHYLYNLIIWHESGDKENVVEDLLQLKKKFGIKSMIDYGCGVGNDSLLLIEKGVDVFPIDYQCPSVDFFNWRLKKRKLNVQIIDVEEADVFPDADLFFAIDVLEHMQDPVSVVDKLSEKTKVFAHLSRFNDKANRRHPFHINFDEYYLIRALKNKGFSNHPNGYLSVWVR